LAQNQNQDLMARTQEIYISTTYGYLHVIDKEGTDILNDKFGGLGEWSFSIAGSSTLSSADCRMKLVHDPSATEFGYAAFTALDVLNRDGVDILSGLTGWGDVLDEIAVYLFVDGVGNPNGLATSVKQDAGNTSLSSIDTKLSSQSTAANQATLNALIGPADGSGPNGLNFFALAAATLMEEVLEELSTGRTEIATQMTTQGSDSSYLTMDGTAKGSFNWLFTLGAGTNGLLTLYGNNEGSNAAYDVAIGNTGSQTATASGVISWDFPWKYIKAVFTTQTGAGSTFDGFAYGV
jgi:hypothetical protein